MCPQEPTPDREFEFPGTNGVQVVGTSLDLEDQSLLSVHSGIFEVARQSTDPLYFFGIHRDLSALIPEDYYSRFDIYVTYRLIVAVVGRRNAEELFELSAAYKLQQGYEDPETFDVPTPQDFIFRVQTRPLRSSAVLPSFDFLESEQSDIVLDL